MLQLWNRNLVLCVFNGKPPNVAHAISETVERSLSKTHPF